MNGTSEWWAEECQRERDLSLNVLMDDGKWMFPVKIRYTIKENENIRTNNYGSNDRNTESDEEPLVV